MLKINGTAFVLDWSSVQRSSLVLGSDHEALASVNVRVNLSLGPTAALYYWVRVTPDQMSRSYSYSYTPWGFAIRGGASGKKEFPTAFVDRYQQEYLATDPFMAALRSSALEDMILSELHPVLHGAAEELQRSYPGSIESVQDRLEHLEKTPTFLRLQAVVDSLKGWTPAQ